MSYDPAQHHRRSIRLKEHDYSWPAWYFVTICSHNRDCIFGEVINNNMGLNTVGKIVEEEWLRTPIIRPGVELDDYVVMPNHLHGIIIIGHSVGATRRVAPTNEGNRVTSYSLGSIIGQFKSVSAKRINKIRGTSGVSMWQRNYYDHIIRNENDLHHIRTYITDNPIQWTIDEENPDNFQVTARR